MAAPINMSLTGLPFVSARQRMGDLERMQSPSSIDVASPAGRTVPLAPQETNATDDDGAETQRPRRTFMTTSVSGRINAMREYRLREAERTRQQERVRDGNLSARFRSVRVDVGRWRNQHLPRAMGGGGPTDGETQQTDLEAQTEQPQATNAAGVAPTVAATSEPNARTRPSGTKTRREREEGAQLFGPCLAQYFGSGSSSSGAVSGASAPSLASNAAAACATSTGAAAAAAGMGGEGTQAMSDPLSPQSTQPRRPRLGSRGRARGASLSGLGQWAGSALESPLPNGTASADATKGDVDSQELAMAEGIELDTLRRWIERSASGGATEIPGLGSSQDGPLADAMCSTLQSYVNLKRNTMRLNAIEESSVNAAKAQSSDRNILPRHLQTHVLQFEYDCAAPYASVQVFVRSSRKHGSWVAWTAAREALGLSPDLTIGADDAESRFFAQRGPPPHILGWPVHVSRVQKGFATPVKVQLALQLNLYAPQKVHLQLAPESGQQPIAEEIKSQQPAPLPSAFIPETPGLDASRRLEDPITPAAMARADPLAAVSSLPTALPAAAEGFPRDTTPIEDSAAIPPEETKEQRLAREKNERETLKVAIVIEALDEDGRPLREPNLQTSYLRLASMPVRALPSADESDNPPSSSGIIAKHIADLAQESNAGGSADVVDVALSRVVPTSTTGTGSTAQQRLWSVQVEGQEAEIGPHRFQLQELYGLSTRPPPPSQQTQQMHDGTDADAVEDAGNGGEAGVSQLGLGGAHGFGDDDDGGANECLICLSAPPTTLLLPCTHGLCLECAVQLRDTVKATRETERRRGRRPKRKYACPVCRRAYTNMLHLRAIDEKAAAQAASA